MKYINRFLTACALFLGVTAFAAPVNQPCSTAGDSAAISSGLTGSGEWIAQEVSLEARKEGVDNVVDTIWYKFTIPEDGFLSLSTYLVDGDGMPNGVSANPNTRVSLYSGSCGSLSLVATSDNDCGKTAMLNDKSVTTGSTYFLMFDNPSTVNGVDFDVKLEFVSENDYTSPANDDICDAIEITYNATTGEYNGGNNVEGSNEYASRQVGESVLSAKLASFWKEEGQDVDTKTYNSVWYTFTAPASGSIDLDVWYDATTNVQVAILEGSCSDFSSLKVIAGENGLDSEVDLTAYCLTPGNEYFILVDAFGIESDDFYIELEEIDIFRPLEVKLWVDSSEYTYRCPGELGYEVKAELISSETEEKVSAAGWEADDYVDALTWAWTTEDGEFDEDDEEELEGEGDVANQWGIDVFAGTYTVTFTDICNVEYTASVTLTDTVIDPIELSVSDVTNPTCPNSSTGSVTVEVSGGYDYVASYDFEGNNHSNWASTDMLLFWYYRVDDTEAELDTVLKYDEIKTTVGNMDNFNELSEGAYVLYAQDACGNYDSTYFVLEDPNQGQIISTLSSFSNPYCEDNTGVIELSSIGGTSGSASKILYRYFVDTDTTVATGGGVNFGGSEEVDTEAWEDGFFDDAWAGYWRIIAYDECAGFGTSLDDTLYVLLTDPVVDSIYVTLTTTLPSSSVANDGQIEIDANGGKGDYRSTWSIDGTEHPELEDQLSATNLPQGWYEIYVWDTCGTDTTLEFLFVAPVSNDEPCDAISIGVDDTLITYSNVDASVATSENSDINIPYDANNGFDGWEDVNIQSSVWFSFVAPASGAAEFWASNLEIAGNLNFDPQIAIFEAGDCNDFTSFSLLAANDQKSAGDNDSYLKVYCLTPGNTYYVLVDGYVGAVSEEGYFSLQFDEISIDPLTFSITDVLHGTCNDPSNGSFKITSFNGGAYDEDSRVEAYYDVYVNNVLKQADVQDNATILHADQTGATYTVKVVDVCGDERVKTQALTTPTFTAFTGEFDLVSPTCPEGDSFDDNGSIDFDVAGGADNDYTFTLSATSMGSPIGGVGTNPVSNNSGEGSFINLSEGTYFLTVEDGCGNSKEWSLDIEEPNYDPVSLTLVAVDPSCPGENDGSIEVFIEGGSGEGELYLLEASAGSITNSHSWFYSAYDETASIEDRDTVTFEDLSENSSSNIFFYVAFDDVCESVMWDVSDTVIVDSTRIVDPSSPAIVIDDVVVTHTTEEDSMGVVTFTVTGGNPPYTMGVENTSTNVVYTVENMTADSLPVGNYDIIVDDNCGSSESYNFDVLAFPGNDAVCDAILLKDGVQEEGDNSAATVQTGEASITPPNDGECTDLDSWCSGDEIDASVWYKYVVPASGAFEVEVYYYTIIDILEDPQVAVYSGSCDDFGSLTLLAANDNVSEENTDSRVEVGCQNPGDTVYILVDNADEEKGHFFIRASQISVNNLSVLGNLSQPLTQTSNDGFINVNVTGGVKPYTYQWYDNGELTTIEEQDREDIGPGVYQVVVTDACGTVKTKTWTVFYQKEANDDVCDAVLLPVDATNRIFSNVGASVQAGEQDLAPNPNGDCFNNTDFEWCSNDSIDGSVWFRFVMPSSEKVEVSLCNDGNNDIDVQVAVYKKVGTCGVIDLDNFIPVVANDDYEQCNLGSVVEVEGDACAEYYILVDSDPDGVTNGGDFGIMITDIGASQSVDAGVNVTIDEPYCIEDIDELDLEDILDASADAGGEWFAATPGADLDGSVYTFGTEEGDVMFYYIVSEFCGNDVSAIDTAVYTITLDSCYISVGEVDGKEVSVITYPNPNNGQFTIESQGAKLSGTLQVFDLSGRVVVEQKLSGNDNALKVEVPNKVAGIYTVRLTNDNVVFVERIVVE